MPYEWHKDDYTISTDRERLDTQLILGYLREAYWSLGRPQAVIERSIRNSESFGLYYHAQQVGFARAVTDYATFAYVCDVFILPQEQGKGLGRWLMETMLAHPELQGLKWWYLRTRDAHGLYKKLGFRPLLEPDRSMERPGNL